VKGEEGRRHSHEKEEAYVSRQKKAFKQQVEEEKKALL